MSEVKGQQDNPKEYKDYKIAVDMASGPSQSGYMRVTFDEVHQKFVYQPISIEEFYKKES